MSTKNTELGTLILLNGVIITCDRDDSLKEAMVVKDNKIVYIGNNQTAVTYAGSHTKVIDVRGKSIVPGFIDSHIHMAIYGANELAIDCRYPNVKSIEDIKKLISEVAQSTPKGQWIRGWGYDHSKLEEGRHPNRWDLDQAAPDHPVMLTRACAHISTHNSRSLALANITADTESPSGGVIDKIDGVPSGVMIENAHMAMMGVSKLSIAEIARALKTANQLLLSQGITSVHDAGGYGVDQMKAIQMASMAGDIDIRIYMMLFSFIDNNEFVQQFIEAGLFTGFGNENLKIGPIKLMIDGSSSGPTAATIESYASDSSNNGILALNQDTIDEIILKAHMAGYQVTAHAVGDKAVTMIVDAIEKALKVAPKEDHRHRIEHCAMINDQLIGRIKALNIITITQPIFLYEFGDGYIKNYGLERAEKMFTCNTFLNNGITSALSSDGPITFSNPLMGIYAAVNRIMQNNHCISENERVSVMQAVKMYTYNGAVASFDEKVKGSLEKGKLADFVMLSENILATPTERIKDLLVDMTVIDGRMVYVRNDI